MNDLVTQAGLVAAIVAPGAAVAGLRATDVVLAICKTNSVMNGRRAPAALFAGLEAAVWLSAAGIVFSDPGIVRGVGFVVGVATGTWLGMAIAHVLRLGTVTVRIFTGTGPDRELAGHAVAEAIRRTGHGATVFSGWGRHGPVDMVLSVVRRREARRVCDAARTAEPTAFVAVDSTPGPGSVIDGLVGSTP